MNIGIAPAAGALSPAVSFALTGMPRPALLPFMVLELAVYGLCAGGIVLSGYALFFLYGEERPQFHVL